MSLPAWLSDAIDGAEMAAVPSVPSTQLGHWEQPTTPPTPINKGLAPIVPTVPTVPTIKGCTQQNSGEIISTLRGEDMPEAANDTRHFRWLVHYQNQEPIEKTFSPELSHAEVLAWHQDAVAAEPIPERTRPTVTPAITLELWALVASVAAAQGFTPDELEEARTVAMRDPVAALESFRALAGELGLSHRDVEKDDRHYCGECGNLISGR